MIFENGELVLINNKKPVIQVGGLKVSRNWFRRLFNMPPKYHETRICDNSIK